MTAITASLTIANDLACLVQVRDLVLRAVARGGFPVTYINRLQIAVDEAITNIIEHGYAGRLAGAASITVTARVDGQRFHIAIEDDGEAFDPRDVPTVDVASHAASGNSNGLGVFLMRRVMDEIDYHNEKGKRNQLVLVKYHHPAP